MRQPNVAKVDVKSFFPRVTYRMVHEIFRRTGFGPEPARLLTQLTTRGGHLPQGAPTSDRLANMHLATASEIFESILADLALNGSAYVDDIAVSGVRTREAIPRIISMLRSIGLGVSRKKCENLGPRQAHCVTGHNTNGKMPTLGSEGRSKIRAVVHRFIVARREGKGTPRGEHAIRTRLGQLRLTNPGDAERLHRQLLRNGIDLRPKRKRTGRGAGKQRSLAQDGR